MDKFDLYRDIASRTGGDIYVGVVGPVRTGKSTLIQQIMEQLVVEGIQNEDVKKRAIDEIPQSADGKTIMTTQPKFVPNEAVKVPFSENLAVNMRLIDCVGYMVNGALGNEENGKERLVTTPWSDQEIPFSQAAEIGTEKVIKEHSTIALIVTTDGSFTDIPREEYIQAEERVVNELKELEKPFAIILNSSKPNSKEAKNLQEELQNKYEIPVILKNALKIDENDIAEIMETILLEFAVKMIDFNLPRWIQALSPSSSIVKELMEIVMDMGDKIMKMKDYSEIDGYFGDTEYWKYPSHVDLDAGKGTVTVDLQPKDDVFYKVLSEECGVEMMDSFDLMYNMKKLCASRNKTRNLAQAIEQVESLGYGVVNPTMDDIILQEPELIRQGQQYGVKIKASAPSLHIMKIDVETEVSPIVGSEEQSEEFVSNMMNDFENDKDSLWETNIFGRSLSSLISDGINNKLMNVPAEAEIKLNKTLGRIVNEGKGGVICILL